MIPLKCTVKKSVVRPSEFEDLKMNENKKKSWSK